MWNSLKLNKYICYELNKNLSRKKTAFLSFEVVKTLEFERFTWKFNGTSDFNISFADVRVITKL